MTRISPAMSKCLTSNRYKLGLRAHVHVYAAGCVCFTVRAWVACSSSLHTHTHAAHCTHTHTRCTLHTARTHTLHTHTHTHTHTMHTHAHARIYTRRVLIQILTQRGEKLPKKSVKGMLALCDVTVDGYINYEALVRTVQSKSGSVNLMDLVKAAK